MEDVKLAIVVPCYNEGSRIEALREDYSLFLNNSKDTVLCFVDDGSKDNTLEVLEQLQRSYAEKVEVISNNKNLGKAETVRNGINYCLQNPKFQYVAFLDADLATPLDECVRLTSILDSDPKLSFVFGSRIAKVDSKIERTRFRFLVGRIIATFISTMLRLKIYDTQCGCKIFRREIAKYLFAERFMSKWLFDVELFYRMIVKYGRPDTIAQIAEVPLKVWIDQGESKVKMSYFFKLWIDMFRMRNKYKKQMRNN